jgi:hypothetical protein
LHDSLNDGHDLRLSLSGTLDSLGGSVGITLNPIVDDRATSQDAVTVNASNGNLGAREVHIVKDEVTTTDGDAVLSPGSDDTSRGIGQLAVE